MILLNRKKDQPKRKISKFKREMSSRSAKGLPGQSQTGRIWAQRCRAGGRPGSHRQGDFSGDQESAWGKKWRKTKRSKKRWRQDNFSTLLSHPWRQTVVWIHPWSFRSQILREFKMKSSKIQYPRWYSITSFYN